jgi:pyrroloquinoline quinone biosynthesis protein D
MPFISLMAAHIADQACPQLARGVRLQMDGATGKQVLLFPEGILELNETAGEILDRCDGRTLRDIVVDLAREYDANEATVAADVREILADFAERKLLQL